MKGSVYHQVALYISLDPVTREKTPCLQKHISTKHLRIRTVMAVTSNQVHAFLLPFTSNIKLRFKLLLTLNLLAPTTVGARINP